MAFVSKKPAFARKAVALVMTLCIMLSVAAISASAANEYYYKGYNIIYNGGAGVQLYTRTYNGGFLWLTKYTEKYYLTNSYMRCLTYYHNEWIANQGQTLTISSSKTKSRSVATGVSAELGVADAVTAKIGTQHSNTVSTSYSTSLGLTYNLSKFSHRSYKIASMGYYDKFSVYKYKEGTYESKYTCYAYDAGFGQEIRLVYRY